MCGWYAIQTKPRKGRGGLASLGRGGLNLLSALRRRRRRGRRIVEAVPLFTCSQAAVSRDYAGIRWTRLVRIA
jgi:hypothetical protein